MMYPISGNEVRVIYNALCTHRRFLKATPKSEVTERIRRELATIEELLKNWLN